jgi:5-dehydro-2-deoxygluconokinase
MVSTSPSGSLPKTIGFDRPLYGLPFDHWSTFQKKMFGWKGALNVEQSAAITAVKEVVYDGFRSALAAGVPAHKAGILVDEQFGSAILRDAVERGYTTALTIEKSEQDEFEFEYGEDFARHIEAFRPEFGKVLVRCNPEGDAAMNAHQAGRLRRLSDYLHRDGRLFMFELLVPPLSAQLGRFRGDKGAFDRVLRPDLMARAIRYFHEAGVEPDVWKIEGLDHREDCERVVEAARQGGRDRVGCIVLGRESHRRTSGRPMALITTDEYAPYREAVLQAYGETITPPRTGRRARRRSRTRSRPRACSTRPSTRRGARAGS